MFSFWGMHQAEDDYLMCVPSAPEERLRAIKNILNAMHQKPPGETSLEFSFMVALLSDTCAEIRLNALYVLAKLAREHEVDQEVIVNSGVLTQVVTLLSDERVCGYAAVVLANFAYQRPVNQRLIIDAGAVLPLVLLLSHESDEVRTYASYALGTLDHVESDIAEASGWPLLLRLLSDRVPDVRSWAAAALADLPMKRYDRKLIAESGAVQSLMSLLTDEHAELRTHGAYALGWLGYAHEDNQKLIIAMGALEPLAALLSDESSQVRRWSLYVLGGLADHCDNRKSIGASGAIGSMTYLLSEDDAHVRRLAVRALERLSTGCLEHQNIILKHGAIRRLLDLVSDPEGETRNSGLTLISRLVGGCEHRLLAEASAVPVLVSAVSHEDPQTRRLAAHIFELLACEDFEQHSAMIKGGAIEPLLRCLSDEDRELARVSLCALAWLAMSDGNPKKWVSEGHCLQMCVKFMRGPYAMPSAAQALLCFLCGLDVVLSKELVSLLMDVLNDGDQAQRFYAAQILAYSMTQSADIQMASDELIKTYLWVIRDEGEGRPVMAPVSESPGVYDRNTCEGLRRLEEKRDDVRCSCAGSLTALLLHDRQAKKYVIESECIDSLCSILEGSDLRMRPEFRALRQALADTVAERTRSMSSGLGVSTSAFLDQGVVYHSVLSSTWGRVQGDEGACEAPDPLEEASEEPSSVMYGVS